MGQGRFSDFIQMHFTLHNNKKEKISYIQPKGKKNSVVESKNNLLWVYQPGYDSFYTIL